MISLLQGRSALIQHINHLEFKKEGPVITTTPNARILLADNEEIMESAPLFMGYFRD